jgi:hypothetical protein
MGVCLHWARHRCCQQEHAPEVLKRLDRRDRTVHGFRRRSATGAPSRRQHRLRCARWRWRTRSATRSCARICVPIIREAPATSRHTGTLLRWGRGHRLSGRGAAAGATLGPNPNPMPTIDFSDDEHPAVTRAVRRTIDEDRLPHAPRVVVQIRRLVPDSEAASSFGRSGQRQRLLATSELSRLDRRNASLDRYPE